MGAIPWYSTTIQALIPYAIMLVAAIFIVFLVFRLTKKYRFVPKLVTFLIVVFVFFGIYFIFLVKPLQSVHIAFDKSVTADKAELFIESLNAEYPVGDYWVFNEMPTVYAHYPDNSYTILFERKRSRFEMKRIVYEIKQNSIVENCESNDEWFWDSEVTVRQRFK